MESLINFIRDIIYILDIILYNIFMVLTTKYKDLYFEEEKEEFDEIGCYCGVCMTTKNIVSFFVKKLKTQKLD